MNPLDIGVIAVIVLSAVFAFARGFVREALSIFSWVCAAAITLYGFNWVYEQVNPRVHNPLLSQVISGFGLFVVSLVVLTILTGLVARTVRFSGLTPIDRTLGFIFGVARGAFLVCLAYLLLDVSVPQPNDRPGWIREARSASYLHEGADMLRGFLPESLKIKSTEAVVDDAVRALSPKATEDLLEKARGAYSTPTPAAPKPDSPAAPSYGSREKQQMDRLIGNQR